MWHWGDLDKETVLPDEIKQLLDRIVAKKIGYQPTFQVLEGERAYFEPEYLGSEEIRKVVPLEMLAWFNTPEGKGFKKGLVDDDTPDEAMREMYDKAPLRRDRQVVAYLAGKKANFLFGTDTPSGPTYGNLPGLNGYHGDEAAKKRGAVAGADLQGRDDQQCEGVQDRFAAGDD